ncbi:Importin-11 [Trichoplax sp. H2]|nr:Importin-11 [Trichoplax sp. H2]|eukprot:RDD46374.1 Importin-11 [Trichoplax sp. H2]
MAENFGLESIIDTLAQATSQSTANLKRAEQLLKSWETHRHFYLSLQTIFSNYEIQTNVRWMAVLYFKNGVDRYWRKTAPNAINEEEKAILRTRLLSAINNPEPVNQIATQIAVLLSKIARIDFPRQWPELVPFLLEAVRSTDNLKKNRALLTLHHAIKAFASKCLFTDRVIFSQIANSIFSYLLEQWIHNTDSFVKLVSQQRNDEAGVMLNSSLLILKVLRKLVIYGIDERKPLYELKDFMDALFQRISIVLNLRGKLGANHTLMQSTEKLLILILKIFIGTQDQHPVLFIPYIVPSLRMSITFIFSQEYLDHLFERFIIHCLNLMKAIVFTCSRLPPKMKIKHDVETKVTKNYQEIVAGVLNEDDVTRICQTLISRFFILTQKDLFDWEQDPEDYDTETGGEEWKYSLRPCTEGLFLVLFNEYQASIKPVVLQLLSGVATFPDPDDLNGILTKDAIYNVTGLLSSQLYKDINFSEWFSSYLLRDIKNGHPNYKILRRRAAWVIDTWMSEYQHGMNLMRIPASFRSTLYEALLILLDPSEDVVVRITTSSTFRTEAVSRKFSNENLVTEFSALVFRKMRVLSVISTMIDRVGSQITPFSSELMQYLPQLWQDSEEHNMLRCSILCTLTVLIQALKSSSVQLYPFLLPVIQFSTDVEKPPHIYLIDDGMELWKMTLCHAPTLTNELLHLFQNMQQLLEKGFDIENLKRSLEVLKSYVILGGYDFMKAYSSWLADLFFRLIYADDTVRPGGHIVDILKVLELIFREFPSEGPQAFQNLLPRILEDGLQPQEYPPKMSLILALLGRLLLQNTTAFFATIDAVANRIGQNNEDIMKILFQIWTEKIDVILKPEHRKLSALALTSVLPLKHRAVCNSFSLILNLCVDVLHEVCPDHSKGNLQDRLVLGEKEMFGPDAADNEEEIRARQLALKDPVHNVPLNRFIKERLDACHVAYGSSSFTELMNTVDIEVKQQLIKFFE